MYTLVDDLREMHLSGPTVRCIVAVPFSAQVCSAMAGSYII